MLPSLRRGSTGSTRQSRQRLGAGPSPAKYGVPRVGEGEKVDHDGVEKKREIFGAAP